MSDWWAAGIKAQQDWMKASRKGLDAGDAMVAWQQAGRRVAEANLAAWKAWGAMWGGKG